MTNEEGRVVADASHLIELIFGEKLSCKDQIAKTKKALPAEPLAEPTEFNTGKTLTGFVQKVNAGRDQVGRGPVRIVDAADSKAEKAAEILAVPLRFVSRKSRTALAVPSNFDPNYYIPKSRQVPNYDLVRKHVFGMSTSRYSGPTFYILPYVPDAFLEKNSRRYPSQANSRPLSARTNPDFIDNATIIYPTAGLGVVHNLMYNSQVHCDHHEDDITCLALSKDGTLAATGCMGKSPVVNVWSTNIHGSKDILISIGRGFFARGVCALEFSWDNRYLIGIGCDDNHIMGIFELATGNKVLEMSCQHGIPPQIKWLAYCPAQQHCEYITREHAGLCDLFVTAGEHHLKIWSFRRGNNSEAPSLQYKGVTMGKSSSSAAKCYTCALFVPCEDKSFDMIASGTNGYVYLIRKGVVTIAAQVIKGRVHMMTAHQDRLYCGGSNGIIKILDVRTLSTIRQFNLLGDISVTKRPASAGSARPRSASAGRVAGRPPSAGAVTARPRANVTPNHAAGRPISRQSQTTDHISHPEDISKAQNPEEDLEAGMRLVTSIGVVPGNGRGANQGTYLLVTLGTGKMVRVDVGSSGVIGDAGAVNATTKSSRDLFYYHTGPIYGLAADISSSQRLFVTVGDDRKIHVWDAQDCVLISKALLKTASRCVHLDRSNSFIAVGSNSGSITVYYLTDKLVPDTNYYTLDEIAYRKDSNAEATDIKFSPDNTKIALGSRDDSIYIYSCQLSFEETGKGRQTSSKGYCILRALHRLRGHSSAITHLDWSYDSMLVLSTCGAYELL